MKTGIWSNFLFGIFAESSKCFTNNCWKITLHLATSEKLNDFLQTFESKVNPLFILWSSLFSVSGAQILGHWSHKVAKLDNRRAHARTQIFWYLVSQDCFGWQARNSAPLHKANAQVRKHPLGFYCGSLASGLVHVPVIKLQVQLSIVTFHPYCPLLSSRSL